MITNPAMVLRHVDYRESDRVVTLFTRDHGRISGLARGVRRSMRRFSGKLDLFSYVELQFKPGRGELHHLEGSTLITPNMGIRDDLYRIAWAGYLSELVERLYGEGEPHPQGFETLVGAMSYLSTVTEPSEGVLRVFELRLLAEAGLLPELEVCVNCRQPVGDGVRSTFAVTRGGPVCERCAPLEGGLRVPDGTLKLLTRGLTQPLDRVANLPFSHAEAVGARDLLTTFLRYHVGTPLRSAGFLLGLEPERRRSSV